MVHICWSLLERVMSYRADKLGDGRTEAGNDNTQGQYRPRVTKPVVRYVLLTDPLQSVFLVV